MKGNNVKEMWNPGKYKIRANIRTCPYFKFSEKSRTQMQCRIPYTLHMSVHIKDEWK